MPAERERLRAARARNLQHREATAAPMPAADAAELVRTDRLDCSAVIAPTPDGMATWRYRLPPGATLSGPAPDGGGGQFWIVLSGDAAVDGATFLPPNSCVFVGPDDAAPTLTAGPGGAEALCMQFPRLARQ